MTRQRLLAIANAHALTLAVERTTTGPEHGQAFRTFEFVGRSIAALHDACKAIRAEWDGSRDFVKVLPSNLDNGAFLEVSSFWCEPAAKEVGP